MVKLKIETSLNIRIWTSLVKNLAAMQETQVQSLDGKDPLENEMATDSSILVWKISWTEEPDGI